MVFVVKANKFQALQKKPKNPNQKQKKPPPHKSLTVSPQVTQIQNSESKGTEVSLSCPSPDFCSWWTTKGCTSCSCSQLQSLWASALAETASKVLGQCLGGKATASLWDGGAAISGGSLGYTGMWHMGMWSGCKPGSAVLVIGLDDIGGLFQPG